MTLLTVPSIKRLPPRLKNLIHDLRQRTVINPAMTLHCLKSAHIQMDDLRPWQQFNHAAHHSYGTALVYQGKTFAIMVNSWVPGDFSSIHAHSYSSTVQSFGNAEYTQFNYDGDLLTTASIGSFKTGSIRKIEAHQIYQLGNPSPHPFMSLHIFNCSPLKTIGKTQVFDLYNACLNYTENPFFCLPGSKIQSSESGLRGDRLTTLRHHQQMLSRVLKIQQHPKNTRNHQSVVNKLIASIEFLKPSLTAP